jgi:hypothetical protein
MTLAQAETGVNTSLTPVRRKRPTVYRETAGFLAFARRIVHRAGLRVSGEDVQELVALVAMREDLDAAIATAIRGLRSSGHTWTEIGAIQGVSKQAAEQWYARRQGSG